MMKNSRTLLFLTLLIAGVAANRGVAVAQQDVKKSLFGEATEAMKAAEELSADILAPKSFREGKKKYTEAEEDFVKGRNLEDIRRKLRDAVTNFARAAKATKLAEITFATSQKARSDALDAEAPRFAAVAWREAELKFEEAATRLEEGKVKSARKKAAEAETLFRAAELDAIKVNYLNETWEMLAWADANDVKDRAPKTLVRARELIQKAEQELEQNRYDTDVARALAQQARYEAKHAIHVSKYVEDARKKKKSLEDVIIEGEGPLQEIAAQLDMVAEFDDGAKKPMRLIINKVDEQQQLISRLSQDLEDRERQVSLLQKRVAEMEQVVGGIEKEKSKLAREMELQAEIRERFSAVEQMFTRQQAVVLRKGDDIIIRLVGLRFPSGKSTIQPAYFGLLTRLQKVIDLFPTGRLTVEGHTDSYGSDRTNMRLSQQRAVAVKQYIVANMDISESAVKAVGLGETRPIAKNETSRGRAMNRRIEIIVHPDLGRLK